MKPTKPQDVYKITAERLQLSEEYVKDAVEHFYQTTKDQMGALSYMIFCFRGLGRFVIRPLRFFRKQDKILYLVDKFKSRRDNRGLMIQRELLKRHEQFVQARPKAEEFNIYKRKKMFKNER